MAAGHQFEHLPLILRERGPARFGPPPQTTTTTHANRENRAGHSRALQVSVTAVTRDWQTRIATRRNEGLPVIAAGIPLLLRIDPSLDLDELRHYFDFEIISEQEDGFVIVASEDVALASFQRKLTDFTGSIAGSASVARIHELRNDPTQEDRLRRILSEELFIEWPTLNDRDEYVVEIGIACVGNWQIRSKPKRGRLTDKTWARKEAAWSNERAEAYDRWDALRDERMSVVETIVRHYNAQILGTFHNDSPDAATLPDSFTLRLRISGTGLRDLVLNYPYVFEVTEPDSIETPQRERRERRNLAAQTQIQSPRADAPTVCVIDSGIQEEHSLLEPGIHKPSSRCFLPNAQPTDIADYVADGGHGTRVAGAVLYGENIPTNGSLTLNAWVQNARVLDGDCSLPEEMFPPAVLRDVVAHYHEGERRTRIFNHSINASSPCRTLHMSAWAAEIDLLCSEYDILVIQSAGNLRNSQASPLLGITELINNGTAYPDYLAQPSCRIANPAQSLQALTVGSVAYGLYEDAGWRSFASQAGESSAFSRCGLGIWNSIKPEVVEFGGDCMHTTGNPPTVGTPDVAGQFYPELVRSTLSGGPAIARDDVGTSYATPKVARIAAQLQSMLPDESCLLYRALIVQSALWPEWAGPLTPDQRAALLKRIGYGIPNMERATTNTNHRSTFISQGDTEIAAGECHIYQIPIPALLRRPGYEYDVRVEITLSYVAEPRRTRRTHRGYLSTWVDWLTNRQGETIEAFRTRALKDDSAHMNEGTPFGWVIQTRSDWGELPGVQRNASTVQKDWAMIKSNALPDDFCIAVRGHRGWSRDPESVATYGLVASFEIVGQEIEIYAPLRTAVLELQSQLEAEVESELTVEVEG
jgi:hypothetical protein